MLTCCKDCSRLLFIPTHATFSFACYSPDMPPIKRVWDLIGRRLTRDPASSKDKLWQCMQAIWNSLPKSDIQNLLDSMLRRIEALIAARSGYGHFIFYFFSLKISSFICTNRNCLCSQFRLILVIFFMVLHSL